MVFHDEERYERIKAFAKEKGLLENFESVFKRLAAWENNENCPCVIHIANDYDKNSFMFWQEYLREDLKGKTGIVGGIIYHGCPSDGYKDNFSVQLSPSYGWSIHT